MKEFILISLALTIDYWSDLLLINTIVTQLFLLGAVIVLAWLLLVWIPSKL